MNNNNLHAIKKAQDWIKNPEIQQDLRNEIKDLIEKNELSEIKARFEKDLSFGTGGLRGIAKAGTSCINSYTIQKATCALAKVVKDHFNTKKDIKIAIAFDSRLHSKKLAYECAWVLEKFDITPIIFKRPTTTPLLSFATHFLKCQAGIVITASHNPKQYNGFKVYWDDGHQITPPIDKEIIKEYKNASVPSGEFLKKISTIEDSIMDNYLKLISPYFYNNDKNISSAVAYSALHGASGEIICRLKEHLNIKTFVGVESQMAPNGNFPTLPSPNPENPSSFDKMIPIMKEHNLEIGLANDPDGDRLGAVIIENEHRIFLTGNQLGAILLTFILDKKKLSPNKTYYVVKTVVTSPLIEKIANAKDVKIFNTITGFKWIGEMISKIERTKPNHEFLFGIEESLGYLGHPFAKDKDGIYSFGLVVSAHHYFKSQKKTFLNVLDELYKSFGLHNERLITIDIPSQKQHHKALEVINKIKHNHFKKISNKNIISLKDYNQGIDSLPKTNMIEIGLENITIFLRPSGTEPKIKIYIMAENLKALNEQKDIDDIESDIKNWFLS